MTKVLALAALSLSLGAGPSVRRTKVAQALTASQPAVDPNLTLMGQTYTASAIPGALKLQGCSGFRVTLQAPVGCTIDAAGNLDFYYWPDAYSVAQGGSGAQPWPLNKAMQQSIAAATSVTACAGGPCRSVTFGDFPTYGLQGGWVYPALNAATMTGGCSQITVYVEANCSQ